MKFNHEGDPHDYSKGAANNRLKLADKGIEKLHARLGYCYSQMNNKLVQPIMSYEEGLD